MQEDLYRNEILAAYTGEIIGAAAFGAMAQSEALLPGQRAQLERLALLEQVTRARLDPVMLRYGLTVENVEAVEAATRAAAGQANDWSAIMESVREGTVPYIARFEALLDAAPEEDAEAMRRLLEHEEALLQFAIDELEGRSETSLQGIEQALA